MNIGFTNAMEYKKSNFKKVKLELHQMILKLITTMVEKNKIKYNHKHHTNYSKVQMLNLPTL